MFILGWFLIFFIGLSVFADFSWFWLILIDFLSVLVNIYRFLVYLCDIWWRYCIIIPVFSVDFGQFFTDLSSIFCIYLSIVSISPFWLVLSNFRPISLILRWFSSSSAKFWAKLLRLSETCLLKLPPVAFGDLREFEKTSLEKSQQLRPKFRRTGWKST